MAKFSVECDSDADTVCLDSDDERGFQKNMKTYVRRVEDRNGSVEKSHHQKGDVPSDIVNQQERSHHRKSNVPTVNQQERSHHQKANVPSVNPQERSHHQKGDVPPAKQQERSHFRKSNVPPVNRQESPHHENGDATSTIQQERSHHQKGHVQSVNPQERSQHQKGDGTSAIQQARSHHLKTYGPSVKRRASSDHQKVDAQSANQQERSHQQQSNVSSVNRQERSQHQKGDAPSAIQQERSHHQEGAIPSVPQQESSLPQASDVPVVNQHERAESSGSPKTFLEQLDSDIIYIRGSDSESDDESIIFITESRNQSELRNLPEDFFDRETPPLSPRRLSHSSLANEYPDIMDCDTPVKKKDGNLAIDIHKTSRKYCVKSLSANLVECGSPPIFPLRLSHSSSANVYPEIVDCDTPVKEVEKDGNLAIDIHKTPSKYCVKSLSANFVECESPPILPPRILEKERDSVHCTPQQSKVSVNQNYAFGETKGKKLKTAPQKVQRLDGQFPMRFELEPTDKQHSMTCPDSVHFSNSRTKQNNIGQNEVKKQESRAHLKRSVSLPLKSTLQNQPHQQKINVSRKGFELEPTDKQHSMTCPDSVPFSNSRSKQNNIGQNEDKKQESRANLKRSVSPPLKSTLQNQPHQQKINVSRIFELEPTDKQHSMTCLDSVPFSNSRTKENNVGQNEDKQESRAHLKRSVSLPLKSTFQNQPHQLKINVSRKGTPSLNNSLPPLETIRITFEIPYSRFLEIENNKRVRIETAVPLRVNGNEDNNQSVSRENAEAQKTVLTRNKTKEIKQRHLLESVMKNKLLNTHSSSNKKSSVQKVTGHNKASTPQVNRVEKVKKKRCEFCGKHVPNVTDHIISNHSELFK